MSKMPDYIATAVSRLNNFLPTSVAAARLRKEIMSKLPFGLSAAYDFYEMDVVGRPFILCGIDGNDGSPTPATLTRHRDAIENLTGLAPIFVFDKVASYNFSRYTKRGLNVIVGSNHIYLPSLFLIVGKDTQAQAESLAKAPASFQLLVLYHLQKEKIDGMSMRIVADRLNLSYATVNRMIRWMQANGFVALAATKEKTIKFLFQGKELWGKALPYFSSPIEFLAYTSDTEMQDSVVSSQNALARYTLLSAGFRRIAISKNTYQQVKDTLDKKPTGDTTVEVWRYDPLLLSTGNAVDKLSLYLILKDDADERVQIELQNMMEEIVW